MRRSTFLGNQFLGDLLDFMIEHGIESHEIKRGEVPVNLTSPTIEHATYDKILKVMRAYSEFDDSEPNHNSFAIWDDIAEREFRVSFTIDSRSEAIVVEVRAKK